MTKSDEGAPEGLETLYADRVPSPGLEDRVLAEWRRVARPARSLPWWMGAAAAIALYAAGWMSASAAAPAPATPATDAALRSPSHILLLWESPDFGTGVDPASFAAEYAGWASRVRAGGVDLAGNEVGLLRSVLSAEGPAPNPAGEMRMGGYFLLQADDDEEAQRIAGSHPHLTHGGLIEVAPIISR